MFLITHCKWRTRHPGKMNLFRLAENTVRLYGVSLFRWLILLPDGLPRNLACTLWTVEFPVKKKKTKCIKIRNFLKNGNLNFRTNDSGSWTSFSGTPPTYIVLPKLNFLVKFNFSCGIESITKCIVLLSLTNWIYKDITWVNTFN